MARSPQNPLRRGFRAMTGWWDMREEAARQAFRAANARESAKRNARIDGILIADAMRNRPSSTKGYH